MATTEVTEVAERGAAEGTPRRREMISRAAAKQLKQRHAQNAKQNMAKNKRAAEEEWLSSFVTYATPKLPPCSILPPWMARVHYTHRILHRGGYFVCAACGALASYKPQKLMQECRAEGCYKEAGRIIRRGRPLKGQQWPDGSSSGYTPPPLQMLVRKELAEGREQDGD